MLRALARFWHAQERPAAGKIRQCSLAVRGFSNGLPGTLPPQAELYLNLAKACTDLDMADRLRAAAADFFDIAGQLGGSTSAVQQQQQDQPDEDT
jgi:hypothetical protein